MQVPYTLTLKTRKTSTVVQRGVKAPISIWIGGDRPRRLQNDLPFWGKTRHCALDEEPHSTGGKAKVAMISKEGNNEVVITRTRHDQEWDRGCRSLNRRQGSEAAQALSEELKKRFSRQQANVVGSLGAVEAQACALATCQDARRDLALPHCFQSCCIPCGDFLCGCVLDARKLVGRTQGVLVFERVGILNSSSVTLENVLQV
mmetsp:Transcript_28040/g.74068  ORF Transcript_28040/g.74068 Transcript_28040/m.74068 type:complete len:203 (-) Transcript_28040:187-795(-)